MTRAAPAYAFHRLSVAAAESDGDQASARQPSSTAPTPAIPRATANGAIAAPAYGDEALKVAMPAIQSTAWALHEGGKSKLSPDTVGIPKP